MDCSASRCCCSRLRWGVERVTAPDPNPFADCDVIICYGGVKVADRHLASKVHCFDDEIIEWLERREQRGRERHAAKRLAYSLQSAYKHHP
jgi:hypothetical protein